MKSFIYLFSALILLSVQTISAQDSKQVTSGNTVESTVIGFSKTVGLSFDETVTKLKDELKKEGFGILTEVDVKATMKKKLDLDYGPYVILGACNPKRAHKALQGDPSIGLLLPCNVVVQEADGGTLVSFADPKAMFELVKDAPSEEVASEARRLLQTAKDQL